jgi:hypothetical protein
VGRYWRQVWLGVLEDKRSVMVLLTPAMTLLTLLQDDRFIAKELSKAELQTMETFGPAYFEYMASAISGNVSGPFV